ncbi:hypothetical protein TrVE_jg3946 [Triparma verrucosa]|uniref:Uncharacterized protein n=1 Tax=Triparma verrucosa TaxID=1606542 RepID=A0A9W7EQY3_9STRA|nr:hypothetical protein TrVE_jg3946 [Triparma verrucosa]
MLMHVSKLFSEDSYDAEVMGVLLIVSQAIIIVLFLAWTFYQKDNMSTSSNGMAIKNLSGRKKKKEEKKSDEEEGGGGVSMKSSVFEATNPMSGKGGEQISGSFRQEGKGVKEEINLAPAKKSTWLGPMERIKKYMSERQRRSYEQQYDKKPKAKLDFSLSDVGEPPPPRRDKDGVEMKVISGGWDGSLLSMKANPLQEGREGGRPGEGETIKLANKKNISKEPPKRKSIFAIPKDKLEEALIGPPKIPPPPTAEDDIGPPPFPPQS